METERSLGEKRELRGRVLRYFKKPNINRFITESEMFRDGKFSGPEIKGMIHDCCGAGLLYIVRGNGSGAVYSVSDDGQILLDGMDIAISNLDNEEGDNE